MLKNKNVELILSKSQYNFDDLCLIMEILRGENGCPWDAEQTHESIRKNFIEETYEVVEAIDNNDSDLLREELGDVLLQVVFHTQMEKEAGHFNINDVANDVCVKLVHRHPHIFGNVTASTSEEVLTNWEAIKNIEKSRETMYDKLTSIPPMLPALMRASKVAKKSGVYKEMCCDDIVTELKQMICNIQVNDNEVSSYEMGEMLFLLASLASKCDVDAEESLFKKTNSFIEKYKN